MKMNEFYAAPEVEIVDVAVEKGILASILDPGIGGTIGGGIIQEGEAPE